MKLTAGQPISPRPLGSDDFWIWATKEANPLLDQLRDFANQRESVLSTLATAATGTYTTIWSEDVSDQVSWLVTANVVARATSGGSARASYIIAGLFFRDGGVLTQQGATVTFLSIESVAAFDARFNISSNTLQVQVLDDGAHAVDWQSVVSVQEVH